MTKITRRQFVRNTMVGMGGVVVSAGLATTMTGCALDELNKARFMHGVASGDPLTDRVILWTRVTPQEEHIDKVRVYWEVSKDEHFRKMVVTGTAITHVDKDFTLKVDIVGLKPGRKYFYRFKTVNHVSPVGTTKTIASKDVEQVKFVVVSCSNYPAGYFNAYQQASQLEDIDASLHLGDYLYEYARGGYASEDAAALGREVLPDGELLTVNDYRQRYAQYRTDPDLQAFHQAFPMIAVWDDHEVANDTWKEGAENHDDATEGDFFARLQAALQAYAEWMPVRPRVDTDVASLYRSFQYGNLVNLMMLDTRLVGRDKQLSLTNYFDAAGNFDIQSYFSDINNPNRTLLGTNQLTWLTQQLASDAKWQVLGQQVLMGKMELPGAIATAQLTIPEFAELAAIAQLAQTNPGALTPEQLQLLQEKGALLQLPSLPYNLDAWDGYPVEREHILQTARANQSNLVVLAGDTHNAWANNLVTQAEQASVGVELATASISSPGLESFLGLDTPQAVLQTEAGVVQLIENLQYANFSDRGFLTVTFSQDQVTSNWTYISDIKSKDFTVLAARNKQIVVTDGSNQIA
ncbi:alkaline phosphatase [Aliikangiella marina]|uniref:Alkaline phosphatase n=1 Tax=Aliikangiella marina TaxID=1712262 RepID=A0A545T6I2_9GAMM|nr:alkaline phosphatase D family protein [Aliikangiella marina]TQV72782.1 alkaline phosphatase [Aliikangiella marina]